MKNGVVFHGDGDQASRRFHCRGIARLTRSGRDAKQVRRLPALAVIRDGGSRTEAAATGGTELQIVRDSSLQSELMQVTYLSACINGCPSA